MGRSYTNINVHIIFHIKSNGILMSEKDLPEIFRYIGGTIRSMSGYAFMVGGRPDHIQVLSSLPITISLSDFVGKIKSNTSRWIKGLDYRYKDFAWHEGYGAFSVSESNKDDVIKYINAQKEHHERHSAHDEFTAFLKRHQILSNNTMQGN